MPHEIMIAASILAADFARLGEHVRETERADRIHVDVMDGHFVRNISMGVPIVASLRPVARLPLETHMMVCDPDLFLRAFIDAGSDSILVHWEGNSNPHRTLSCVKTLGKCVGVAINPGTPAAVLEEILPDLDQVLVMAVDRAMDISNFSARPYRRSTRFAK